MRYLALLRGINVGGNTKVPMPELKGIFEEIGFTSVVTYINSGNVAFDTRKATESKLTEKLENAVEARFGKAIAVIVREQRDIDRVLQNNPFQGEYESHKEMHVLFLKEVLQNETVSSLNAAAKGGERSAVSGREIYCHLPAGVADSLLGKGFLDKKLRIVFTGRNWRTVERLATL